MLLYYYSKKYFFHLNRLESIMVEYFSAAHAVIISLW